MNMNMNRNPDIDHQPTPPDDDEKIPERLPSDQPGRREREEGEPDPPPIGDPPNNEPIRVLDGRTHKADRLGSFAPTRSLPSRFRLSIVLILGLAIALGSYPASHASEKKRDAANGTAVLWKEPVDIETRDPFLGSGGDENKPDLSKVTFQQERRAAIPLSMR